jgi:hypothetical protein
MPVYWVFQGFLNSTDFIEALPCFLPPDQASQQRLPALKEILLGIAELSQFQ